MNRTYEYHGFTIVVAIESDFGWRTGGMAAAPAGYVAVVRISRADSPVALFSPLRFGEAPGRSFATEADALMGGYSAARRMVDDVFSAEGQ
jgi:hypothetical protein